MKKLIFIGALLTTTSQVAMAQSVEPAAAEAQQSDQGIADIVVTAQRREESLQEVPISITALDSSALEARGLTNISSFQNVTTPGLVVNSQAGNSTVLLFNMRGISASDPTTGLTDQGVAVYTDGVPIARSVGAAVELGDVERVEVLRGPQGTLFGRNAQGGAIQFVSRRPTGELGGRFEGQIGNFGARRGVVHLNLPEFANISVKLSGLVDSLDGWIKNAPNRPGLDTVPDEFRRDTGFNRTRAFRAAALWEPSDSFSAYYTFDYTRVRLAQGYQQRTGGRTPVAAGYCAVPNFAALCTTGTPAQIGATIAANTFTGTRPADIGRTKVTDLPLFTPVTTSESQGHTLILEYQANDNLTIKSISGLRMVEADPSGNLGTAAIFIQFVPKSLFDGVGPDVPIGTNAGVSGVISTSLTDQRQLSEELQLVYSSDRVQATAGVFYFNERVFDSRDTFYSIAYIYTGTPNSLTAFSGTPFPLAPSLQTFNARAKSYAAYGQVTWTPPILDDNLHLTAGLRYTDDTKFFNRILQGGVPSPANVTFSASRVDPAFVIAYNVSDDVNIYAKYSSAYRAGGVNIRDKIGLSPYDAQVNKSWEIGLKSTFWDRRARFNIAAFSSTVSGMGLDTQNSTQDPSSTFTFNAPFDIKFKGFEADLTLAPIDGLQLNASYSFLDAEAGADTVTVPGIGVYDFEVPVAPKHQLALSADYSVPIKDDIALSFHIDHNYTSSYVIGGLLPRPPASAPARPDPLRNEVTNLRIAVEGIKIAGSQVTLAFLAQNLFNTLNSDFSYALPHQDYLATPPGGAAFFSRPRTYSANLKVEF